MVKLYIAEKPSLARAIANGIGSNRKDDGAIVCENGDIVTFCFGHLLGLKDPPEYDPRYKHWREEDLPIIPDKFEMKPNSNDGAAAQLKRIGKLIKSKVVTSIVHAGDPDREGQLIVDEVLEWHGNTKPVERIWLASLNDEAITKALSSLSDNTDKKHVNESLSARCRSEADWVVGMSLTRAMTIRTKAHGIQSGKSVSVGRVQTATLSLIANRDREIENFVATDFYIPMIKAGGITASMTLSDKNALGMDEHGKLTDKRAAEDLIYGIAGTAVVDKVKKTVKKKNPPLPYSLSTLQKDASSRLGVSATKVLEHCQSLYEEGAISYPRTDCNYLDEGDYAESAAVISGLVSLVSVASQADHTIKGPAWNTKKVTAHPAMMPTTKKTSSTGDTHNIYLLIVEGYLRQFFESQVIEQLLVVLKTSDPEERFWTASVNKTIVDGWTVTKPSVSSRDKTLPPVNEGDLLDIDSVWIDSKQTKPPAHFDDGTLIEAMANVHRFVTDPEVKAILKENAGIGTEATRANMIEVLFKRKYTVRSGKKIKATDLGHLVNDNVPKEIRDPGMTAMWEGFLDAISQGQASPESFNTQIANAVTAMVDIIAKTEFPGMSIKECPTCSKPLSRLESKKKKGSFFWACSGRSDDCPLLKDNHGEPGAPFGK
jgi:DNA topoisomerase-3